MLDDWYWIALLIFQKFIEMAEQNIADNSNKD